jgi:hypothetical protein
MFENRQPTPRKVFAKGRKGDARNPVWSRVTGKHYQLQQQMGYSRAYHDGVSEIFLEGYVMQSVYLAQLKTRTIILIEEEGTTC